MLHYKNPAVAKYAANYNMVYRTDLDNFQHRVTFKAIDQFLASNRRSVETCIDIGCGQGQVLAHVADNLRKKGNGFVGIDISDVAIEQCEERRPDLTWIVDDYKNFLDRPEFKQLFPAGVDLIVNKGGFTHVRTEADYSDTMQKTREALSERGHFLYIKSKKFYHKWTNLVAGRWEREPLQIVFDNFGEPIIVENLSYHILFFPKIGNSQPASVYPRDVEIEFLDGSRKTYPVYHDVEARSHVAASLEHGSDDMADTIVTDIRLSAGPFANMLLTKRLQNKRNLSPATKILDASLLEQFEVTAHELEHAPTRRIIFGGSLSDWLIDRTTGQTVVDPDEFENRMDWLLSKIMCSGRKKATLIVCFPGYAGRWKKFEHSPEAAEPFRAALKQLTSKYDVRLRDLTDQVTLASRGLPLLAAVRARKALLKHGMAAIEEEMKHE